MIRSLLLTSCAFLALTGLALAQATQPTAPPAGAAQPAAPAAPPAGTTPAQPGAAPSVQGARPGIRTVDPTTLRLTYYTVTPADMLASRLMDLDVHNLQNEEIGEIEDLILDDGKTIRGIVLEIGGFLGIGERRVVVAPSSILITREGENNLKAVVNTTKDELQKAPEFKFEGNFKRE
ncbi:PRC-barrel domain-containing protein [Microvirga splendida]|uniref:PRC-barrel domain-containing protein n=1 Tax=Microvirga splendida TaxID=2795727 RepID=A0ABS0Y825_9HYPH|nr:PRC-barrel domain-containing protein [Microvirga splendida]MBJ6128451.1 PRC-barrel domain-containing protein [Microvirga splendida]